MKYLCLIYDEEKKLASMGKAEADAFMGEYFAFTEDIRKSGHYVASDALQPVHTRDDRPPAQRQAVDDRRPVRRDEGAARRLLPDRGARTSTRPSRSPRGSRRSGSAASRCGPSRSSRASRRAPRPRGRMTESGAEKVRETIDALYRSDSRRVLATLIRLLGDFDLAEEALHDAFAAAVERWPADGVPANPRAWLVSAGRFRAHRRAAAAGALRQRRRPRSPRGSASTAPPRTRGRRSTRSSPTTGSASSSPAATRP